jgi:FtsX-like permease family protein
MRADWVVVLAAWTLLLAATTLLTGATLYADAVALGSVRTSVRSAAPADRSAVVSYATRAPDSAAIEPNIGRELDHLVAAGGGGDVWQLASLGPFGFGGDDAATAKRVTSLATRPEVESHATLASGSWATPGANPRQATLSVGAAEALGLRAGDHLSLVDRVQGLPPADVVITGIWKPDPTDPYWLDSALDLSGTLSQASFTTIGPVVVPEADLLAAAGQARISFEWRAIPDVDRLTADSIGPLSDAAAALPTRLHAVLPAGLATTVETKLPDVLAATDRTVLVSRSGIVVLILEFGVVAAYAIILVAGLLGDRRRGETALVRSRGGSAGSVIGMAFLEAVILAGTAALVAPVLSVGVVSLLGSSGPLAALGVGTAVQVSPGAIEADLIGAAAGVLAMTVPALFGTANLAGFRAAVARPVGRTLGQRLGLDLVLVVLAGIALWQLRLYGAPLTKNARGVLGVDPLLVAAPAIGLIAGAVLATRLVPRLAELAEPLLVRGRGLVGALGGRAIARRPLRYTRSTLLLMLAAALGTFSIANVATWTRSQADQAAYQAGADVRIIGTRNGSVDALAVGPAYRAIPGVDAAMAVDRMALDSGRSVRGGSVLAFDGLAGTPIVNARTDADAAAYQALFPQLAGGRSDLGMEIPATARRISFVADPTLVASFIPDPTFVADLPHDQGLELAVILADQDGRLERQEATFGFLSGHDQRLVIDLRGGGRVRLVALELTIAPGNAGGSFTSYGVTGSVELKSFETSAAATGDSWTPVAGFPAAGGTWTWMHEASLATYHPPPGHPALLRFGNDPGQMDPPFGSGGSITVRLAWLPTIAPLPAIVDPQFLQLTSTAVGDEVPAAIQGSSVTLRIVGTVAEFPTLDPAKPFAIVDGPTLALQRYAATGSTADPGEWWVSSSDPEAVAPAVASGPNPDATVISRAGLERSFAGDPSGLGVIGLLGLGSVAAMVFAAIGFLVSAAISTSERGAELALLRALGLSRGQISRWLTLEHAALLVVGIGTGVGIGTLLAWLVLPFSTLTRTGEPALPAPVVVVPLESLVPIIGVALVILLLTTLALRSQLGRVQVGNVLRARAES